MCMLHHVQAQALCRIWHVSVICSPNGVRYVLQAALISHAVAEVNMSEQNRNVRCAS